VFMGIVRLAAGAYHRRARGGRLGLNPESEPGARGGWGYPGPVAARCGAGGAAASRRLLFSKKSILDDLHGQDSVRSSDGLFDGMYGEGDSDGLGY
jgi:hypothetical protein